MEDSDHGLPDLLHPCRIFGVGLHAESDRVQHLIPREISAEGGVTGVRGEAGDGVLDDTSSGT